ncbi:ester cyclase [Phormidium tenue FACHB-886]|nr:ester cyclase [Phormidium tenue FACHB-886]
MSIEMNKSIVRRYYEEVFNQREIDVVDELIADKFIDNDPTPAAAKDKRAAKQFIFELTEAFPDHHHEIIDLIAEDDKVVMHCVLTATHRGAFIGLPGVPPTGRSIRQQQIHILRIQNNKIAEHWVIRDDLAMMQQLGIMPALISA